MERTNRHHPGRDTTRLWSSFGGASPSPAQSDESTSAHSQEIGVDHVPVFLDRTFRMVEEVPDDIVCWSAAGDSFIIKQVLMLEEILPSYFNHNKFMSFVRQLNFYGFKKTKGRSRISSRSKSTKREAYGDGAVPSVAAQTESETWEEFRHPQFRRGRRDLLSSIKRQKDGGRLKRKRADAQKSDIMSSLVTDVGTVNGELKAVKSKLDSIMSLLFNMGGNVNSHAVPSNSPVTPSHNVTNDDAAAAAAAAAGRGRDGARFGGGCDTNSFSHAKPSAAAARGGYGQWLVAEGSGGGGNGGTRGGGDDPYARGALFDYRTRLPVDHQQGQLLQPELSQQASGAERHSVVPSQTRYHVVQPQHLPPLGEAVAARASESASVGPSRHQLPPLHLTPPRLSEVAAASSSCERKQGGNGDGEDTCPAKAKVSPPHRGGGWGGDVSTSPSSAASASNGDPHDAQPQLHASRPPRHARDSVVTPPSGEGAGQRGAAVSQMQQGLSNGTMSMLQVLSESAAAETEKETRANSINSTGTRSSFEYD